MIRTHKSSQIYAIARDQATGQPVIRFNCFKCKGSGEAGRGVCATCRGEGHTGSYHYEAPAEVSDKLYEAAKSGKSVGHAVHELLKKPGYKFTFKPYGGL